MFDRLTGLRGLRSPVTERRRAEGRATAIIADDTTVPVITTASGGRTAVVPASWDAFLSEPVVDPMTVEAPTVTSVQDGSWSDPATWDTGVPTAGDTVSIAHDVTYDVESEAHIRDVIIETGGVFRVDPQQDTKLVCDTIFGKMGSEFIAGESSAPIENSSTPGKPRFHVVYRPHVAPGASPRLGMMTMGKTRIHGAAKKSYVEPSGSISAGATSFVTDDDLTNWRVGDTLIFGASQRIKPTTNPANVGYTGPRTYWYEDSERSSLEKPWPSWKTEYYAQSNDEVRTIAAIDPATGTVTIDAALNDPHVIISRTLKRGQEKTFRPRIMNMTHSILFETDPALDLSDVQNRAHSMFMSDDVIAAYAEAKNMGRTKTDATLVTDSSVTDNRVYTGNPANGGTPLADPQNVRGRYPWHIHKSGPFFAKKQVVFFGLTAWAPKNAPAQPGWGIVHHGSRAAIENCTVYHTQGAGMVSELGNEIGQWINNCVVWSIGDGFEPMWGGRYEKVTNHHGSYSIAYENQARQVLLHRNWASSCRVGMMYLQQNNHENVLHVPDEHSLRYRDPITQGGMKDIVTYVEDFTVDDTLYGIEQAQIPDFVDNVFVGVDYPIWVGHRQFTDRADMTPMLIHGMFTVDCRHSFFLENYSLHYYFFDSVFMGPGHNTPAIDMRTTKFQGMFFSNIHIEGYNFVARLQSINLGGFFVDVTLADVPSGFDNYVQTANYDPTTSEAWNLMGQSVDNGDGTFTPAPGVIYDSDTDLPIPYPDFGPGAELGLDQSKPEPLPGTPKPYFYLDPGSDLVLRQNDTDTLKLGGVIVDGLGQRRAWHGYFYAPTGGNPNNTEKDIRWRHNYNATGADIVERNGCFDDNGTWKTRLWFIDVDRLNGEHFVYSVDVPLSGTWNAQVLADNTVDPNATKPQVPLLPEAVTL